MLPRWLMSVSLCLSCYRYRTQEWDHPWIESAHFRRRRWELVLIFYPLLDLGPGLEGVLDHAVCGVPADFNIIFNEFILQAI